MTRLLQDVYDRVTDHVSGLAEADFEHPTRATAWNLRQLLFHQLLDAQRALVALGSPAPAGAEPDVDAVTYWRPFRPSHGDGGAAHARYVVRAADAYDEPADLVGQWAATSRAAGHVASVADPAGLVSTQGHLIRVDDLVSTLVVEATIHLLDAYADPPAEAVAHTLAVLEGIHGGPLPRPGADDTDVILRATGRLPSDVPAYPLLG